MPQCLGLQRVPGPPSPGPPWPPGLYPLPTRPACGAAQGWEPLVPFRIASHSLPAPRLIGPAPPGRPLPSVARTPSPPLRFPSGPSSRLCSPFWNATPSPLACLGRPVAMALRPLCPPAPYNDSDGPGDAHNGARRCAQWARRCAPWAAWACARGRRASQVGQIFRGPHRSAISASASAPHPHHSFSCSRLFPFHRTTPLPRARGSFPLLLLFSKPTLCSLVLYPVL